MTEISLRIATWNVRKALGTDRRRDPLRVLRVIAAMQADVVLLQEADLRLPPRRPVFVADEVAALTGLTPVSFGHGRASMGWHGNAVLLRPGIEVSARSHRDLPGLEPRGCVAAVLEVGGQRLRVIGAHLGLLRASRRQQLTALLGFLDQDGALPTLIGGDFNERSLEVGLGRLSRRFRILSGGPTYHSRMPVFPLDRIAVTPEFRTGALEVVQEGEASEASDHLPLVGDFVLAG